MKKVNQSTTIQIRVSEEAKLKYHLHSKKMNKGLSSLIKDMLDLEIAKGIYVDIQTEDVVEEIFSNVNNRSATEREMEGIKYGIRLACTVIDHTKYKLGNEVLLAELKTLEDER